MTTEPLAFDAAYSPELIEQAARTFRDYRFKRYGPLLVAACIVNALGFALLIWFDVTASLVLAADAFIAIIGPVWLVHEYFLGPLRHAAQLRRVLPLVARISVRSDALSVDSRGKEASIPWSRVREVVETGGLFLLVLSPVAFGFIPRAGMPMGVYEVLHAKSRSGAATTRWSRP